MKKLLFFVLVLVLTACSTAAPAQPTVAQPQPVIEQPTATPQVIVQTVVVTVVPTDAPTEVPANTPLPPPTVAPADTQAPAPTQEVAPPPSGSGPIAIDNALGAGWFTNMTRSGDAVSLRCKLLEKIVFTATPTDKNISEVNLYYRIEDKTTGFITEWKNAGRMIGDGSGNFAFNFLGETVNPDLRRANAWLDFQFVGLAKSGDVVGRSEKITNQVTYTIECP